MDISVENLTKNTALVTGLIIIGALLNKYVYYTYYNINIVHFLDISEIIVSNFSMYIQLLIYISALVKYLETIKYDNEFKHEEIYDMHSYIKLIGITTGLNIFLIYLFTSNTFGQIINSKYSYILVINLLIIPAILNYKSIKKYFKLSDIITTVINDQYKKYNTLLFALFASLYLIINTTYGVFQTINSRFTQYKVSFTYKEKLFETNTSLKFIGQTRNYLFLYNPIIKKTTVYKIDDLELLSFGGN